VIVPWFLFKPEPDLHLLNSQPNWEYRSKSDLLSQQKSSVVAAVGFSTPTLLLSSIQAQLSERQGLQRFFDHQAEEVLVVVFSSFRYVV